jgi:hypothetical protein
MALAFPELIREFAATFSKKDNALKLFRLFFTPANTSLYPRILSSGLILFVSGTLRRLIAFTLL